MTLQDLVSIGPTDISHDPFDLYSTTPSRNFLPEIECVSAYDWDFDRKDIEIRTHIPILANTPLWQSFKSVYFKGELVMAVYEGGYMGRTQKAERFIFSIERYKKIIEFIESFRRISYDEMTEVAIDLPADFLMDKKGFTL